MTYCQSFRQNDQLPPLSFSGEAVHGGDVWTASRRLGRPLDDILDLSAPLNPLGPPPGLEQALQESMGLLRHYPDRRAIELRQSLADYLGNDLGPQNILPGNGASSLIRLVTRSLEVKNLVLTAPVYGEFPRSMALHGRHFHYLILPAKQGLALGHDDLGRLWELNPSGVVVTNPTTPAGTQVSLDVLDQLLEGARRRRVWLVVDEAFIDFAPPELRAWAPQRIKEYQRLLVLRSFTKFFGLAGLRLGYLMAHKDMLYSFSYLGEPWSVNTMAQAAGVFCLRQTGYMDKAREVVPAWREEMVRVLTGMGLEVMESQTNLVLAKMPADGPRADQVSAACAEQGVLVRDCANFVGCSPGHLRLTVCDPAQLPRLKEALGAALTC
jgi:threonine-phosphate decarboxylase